MNSSPKVAVLLSSYNGEKYIAKQIESIFIQKNVDVTLFVSDDCSTDSTLEIVKKLSNKYKIIYSKNKTNKNFTYNFLDLIYAHLADEFDYFAIADQDDFWLDDKLISGINMLVENNAHFYCSNLTLVDEKLKNPLPMNKFKIKHHELSHYLLENIATGCTVIFDKDYASILKKHYPKNIYLHDYWLFLVALATSKFVYDNNSHILYRQHGHNQIGGEESLQGYYNNFTHSKMHRDALFNELLIGYKDVMRKDDIYDIETFLNYKKSIKSKMKIFFCKRFNPPSNCLLRKIKLLFNKY